MYPGAQECQQCEWGQWPVQIFTSEFELQCHALDSSAACVCKVWHAAVGSSSVGLRRHCTGFRLQALEAMSGSKE
ncbi:TPA: hypothetical protein ACH3X2_006156 [Trebouxia sp. C0005]